MDTLMISSRTASIGRWFVCWALLILMSAPSYGEDAPVAFSIQSTAPDFALPGIDGKVHKLNDFRSSKVLVIVFLCNHCTTSQLYESRVEKIVNSYRDKGVAVVAIQSSNPESVPVEELAYSDVGDSVADMKVRAAYRHFNFPYLYDGDTQKIARSYGATVAPQAFVFDGRRKLRYQGAIDDNVNESLSKQAYVRDAIDALLAGKPVAETNTKASGCETQWISNSAEIQARRAKLEAEPVGLALVSADELTKLRANPTGKLLLVNFYATWCGPCVSEFPDLIATNRMFRGRNFALTTVSSNEPDEQADVLKFLKKMHGSTTNLLFSTTDTYAMQAAFDPAMGAAVPFTVLIAPNGEILFQQQGDLDMMELRRAILANLPDDSAHEGAQKYWASK